jgi:hypothetical protein
VYASEVLHTRVLQGVTIGVYGGRDRLESQEANRDDHEKSFDRCTERVENNSARDKYVSRVATPIAIGRMTTATAAAQIPEPAVAGARPGFDVAAGRRLCQHQCERHGYCTTDHHGRRDVRRPRVVVSALGRSGSRFFRVDLQPDATRKRAGRHITHRVTARGSGVTRSDREILRVPSPSRRDRIPARKADWHVRLRGSLLFFCRGSQPTLYDSVIGRAIPSTVIPGLDAYPRAARVASPH